MPNRAAGAVLHLSSAAPEPATLESVSPADGSRVGVYRLTPREAVPGLLGDLRAQADLWAGQPLRTRLAHLRELRSGLAARSEELAAILACEIGRPVVEGYGAEIIQTLRCLEWLEKNAGRALRPERLGGRRWAGWEPYGVIGLLSPWNYPVFLALPILAAALAAGNAVLWKPSELALATSALLSEILEDAGLGSLVARVTGGPAQGEAVAAAGCDKYVVIGGVETGRRVLSELGRQLKPAVAELSGVDPMLVCADADLNRAVDAAVWGRLVGAGQTCMAPRRIYVECSRYGEFLELALRRVRALRLGDPLDPETEVGPLRTEPLRYRAVEAIEEAEALGARRLWGGEAPDLRGWYLTPALLAGCDERMRVFREDLLAPILAVAPVATLEEAVSRANAGSMGLTASVWSRDARRGEALARRLRAGVVSVNEMIVGAADPGTPFGGVGDSGYGRIRGVAGLREMARPRVMEHGPPASLPRRHQFPYRTGTLEMLRAVTRLLGETGRGRLFRMGGVLRAVRGYNREP